MRARSSADASVLWRSASDAMAPPAEWPVMKILVRSGVTDVGEGVGEVMRCVSAARISVGACGHLVLGRMV